LLTPTLNPTKNGPALIIFFDLTYKEFCLSYAPLSLKNGFATILKITKPEMATPSRIFLFILLLGIFLLGLMDVQIISPILPKLAEDFSVSPAVMGTAVSAYAIAAALWALIIGPLSDRLGRLIFLRAAAWVYVGAAAIAFFAMRFESYLAARVLAGLAGGTISACVIAQVADLFAYQSRGRAMGWLGAMYFISSVIAVPLGAWITAGWGWRILYIPFALLGFVIGLLIRPTSPAPSAQNSPIANPASFPTGKTFFSTATLRQQIQNYPHYLMKTTTRFGLMLAMAVSATAAGLLTYLGVWLVSDFGMSVATIGVVFMVTGVASVVGALGGGWMADWLGKRRMIAFSSFLLAIILFSVIAVKTRAHVFLFCAIGGLAMALREGPFQALISELAPATERGAYIALRNAASQLAIAVSAAICGVLFERFGFQAVAYFATGCSFAASGLVFLIAEPANKT
jgi:predicted MFS family arabinose efflux permease